jgi:hypothetical protein
LLASKTDLEPFATKQDLERFATKSDLEQFATKSDIANMATKSDISDVRREIAELKADVANKLLTVVGFQTIVVLGALVGLFRLLQP